MLYNCCMTPDVSVITPAYNAEPSLRETLDSILAQTLSRWELVLIDDGSVDRTVEIAKEYAGKDPRIRLVKQQHAGVCAARNRGLAEASGDFVLFLDADDLLLPAMLEQAFQALSNDPEAVAAYTGWARLAENGTVIRHEYFRDEGDLFPTLATIQPFCIHTCLARRSALLEVGEFDESLKACEDWDLWQRLARTGGRFINIPDELVLYRANPSSASQDPLQMFHDGLRILAQGHSPDPRVRNPKYENGLSGETLRQHQYRLACWSAGLAIGQGLTGSGLLDVLPNNVCHCLDIDLVANAFVQSLLLPSSSSAEQWPSLWPRFEREVVSFLSKLEQVCKSPCIAKGAQKRIEELILKQIGRLPQTIGFTRSISIDVCHPVKTLSFASELELVICQIMLAGERIGAVELPVFDSVVPAEVITDVVASELTWPILNHYFRCVIEPDLRVEATDCGTKVWRGPVLLAENLSKDNAAINDSVYRRVGWTLFLQELWGKPEWPESKFYDHEAEEPSSTVKLANSSFQYEISADPPHLVCPKNEVHVVLTVGGHVLGEVAIATQNGSISAARLRSELIVEAGEELARAAVREALLGQTIDDKTSLRERLKTASQDRISSPRFRHHHGVVFSRRKTGSIDSSVSRTAALPAQAFPELAKAASFTGEPFFHSWTSSRDQMRVVYSPELLSFSPRRPSEQETIFNAAERLGETHTTEALPILMYHQITRAKNASDNPFSLTKVAFEEQLAVLRALGFHSVTLAQWRHARKNHVPLPGRAILMTFDDGCRDFFTIAWPLLKKYDFGATIFVVTNAIEQGRYCDRLLGTETAALSWDELRLLRDEGVEIGSHTASHPFLKRISATETVQEFASSRAVLTEKLNQTITAVAYPFGDHDPLIHHLAGACGYIYGLTCSPSRCSLWDPLMALPRFDAGSNISVSEFAERLGLAHPSPTVRRSSIEKA